MIDGPFTIRGIAQAGDGSWGNINLLTTLARDRILRLVEQGLPVQIAKEQAEREVLALVHIPEEVMGSFSANDLDISAGGPADAMLLALTLIVLGEANPISWSSLFLIYPRNCGTMDLSYILSWPIAFEKTPCILILPASGKP